VFNIVEGTAKHKEEVFQARLKLMHQAYLDGWFNEDGTVPMPEITADGERPEPVVPRANKDAYAAAMKDAAARRKARAHAPPEPNPQCKSGFDFGKRPLERAEGSLGSDWHAFCTFCGVWWELDEADAACPTCSRELSWERKEYEVG